MKTANRSTIGVIAAVLLALVGGLLLWRSSNDSDSGATEIPVDQVEVLVASVDIGPSTAAADMAENAFAYVQVVSVPADQVVPKAITSVEELSLLGVAGNYTVTAIASGAPLSTDQFIVPGDQVTTQVEPADNLFTMTVLLDTRRALGGLVVPGQHVAVVGSFEPQGEEPAQTVIVLEDVKVVSIYSEVLVAGDPQANALSATTTANTNHWVTFELTADQVERLSYAVEFGRISLAGQGEEATVEDSEIRDRDNVVVPLSESGAGRPAADGAAD